MANNLADIVNVQIDLNQPPVDRASFDHLLILAPPPMVKYNPNGTVAENNVPAVGVYSSADEVKGAGFDILGENADPAGAGARVAFSAAMAPDKVYIATQQPAAYDTATNSAVVTDDIPAIIGETESESHDFDAGVVCVAVQYPHSTDFCAITKNGVSFGSSVTIAGSESGSDYCIIALTGESDSTFSIVPPDSPAQGKNISLAYIVRWENGEATLQTINHSDLEDVEETLDRAIELDGWYVLCPCGIDPADYNSIAAWIEAHDKMASFTLLGDDSSIAEVYLRSFEISHNDIPGMLADNRYINVAYAARFLSYPTGSEMWENKELAGIEPDAINSTKKAYMEEHCISLYTTYAGVNVVRGGKVKGGEWIDLIRFRDWLKNDMQIRTFNLMKTSAKLPYTDNGIALVRNQMIASLKSGQAAGGIAETEYDAEDNEIPWFRTSVPLAASITPTQKASRVLKGCTFSARIAGAIRMVELKGAIVYELPAAA
jgi:hypothetical protein